MSLQFSVGLQKESMSEINKRIEYYQQSLRGNEGVSSASHRVLSMDVALTTLNEAVGCDEEVIFWVALSQANEGFFILLSNQLEKSGPFPKGAKLRNQAYIVDIINAFSRSNAASV
jgi:hypothetical protein